MSVSHGVEFDSRFKRRSCEPTRSARTHGLDVRQIPRERHARGEFAAAVDAVGIAPLAKRFFAIEENDPHGHGVFPRAYQARKFEHHAGGRAAIVRAHEIREELAVVMRGEHTMSGLDPGILATMFFMATLPMGVGV